MRKFYAALLTIIIFPFIFPIFCKAYTQDEFDLFKQEYLEYYGGTIGDKYIENILMAWENGGITNNLGKPYLYTYNEAGSYRNSMLCDSATRLSGSLSVVAGDLVASPSFNQANDNTSGALTFNPTRNNFSIPASYKPKFWGTFQEWKDGHIDFDTLYYSPNIPVPDMNVYYILSSNVSSQAFWNAEMSIADNSDFYIQYGIKMTVPTLVGIGLDSSSGDYTYSYEQYSTGSYIDIKSLEDLTPCTNISLGSADMSSSWNDVYETLIDTNIPDFYSKVPFWIQNPSAAKYLSAQDYYKTHMMNQMPMFGNRLEIFARFFTLDDENRVVVGDWLHWSSRTGSRTQEKPSNYIDQMELPGYINQSNNTDLENQEDTYQTTGDTTGSPTIINNNYAPNYPDYPTIASYNKDNLLLETMGYMGNMNNFLSGPNGFGSFLTEVFTFIPSYVWGMVAMGFGVAIIVMFIKML